MLSDKVWVTRKTRIIAEKRLNNYSVFSQILLIWYALFLVAISLWNLSSNNYSINLVLSFGSILILALSIFLSSRRFIERSLEMRNCYIHLDKIYLNLRRAEEEKNLERIEQLQETYSDILGNIENHSEYDYLSLRFSLRNDNNSTLPPFLRHDLFRFFAETTFIYSVAFILLLLPFIILKIVFTIV